MTDSPKLPQLESALLDRVNRSASEFTGNACHTSFNDHYSIALDYIKASPEEYHELMHGMLVYAS